MDLERYIVVQGVKLRDNTIIPIWDTRINFEETEDYGNKIAISGMSHERIYDTVQCIYDLKTKTISIGVELDYYPLNDLNSFKVDEIVLYEKSNRTLKESKIVDIVFEKYDLYIRNGCDLENNYRSLLKETTIVDNCIYAVKYWQPYYILEDGTKITSYIYLYHKNLG